MSELSVNWDKEISILDDGFHYFWPNELKGCLSSNNLRNIADRLDELNKPWSDEISGYFSQLQSNEAELTEAF